MLLGLILLFEFKEYLCRNMVLGVNIYSEEGVFSTRSTLPGFPNTTLVTDMAVLYDALDSGDGELGKGSNHLSFA